MSTRAPGIVDSVAAVVLCGTCFVARAAAQDPPPPPPNMAAYFVGLLKAAPGAPVLEPAAAEALQARHIASLERRWREKTLVGAGPLVDGGELRGILLIVAPDLQRARAVASDDPAVAAGRLRVDVHPWWGPKGIGDGYAAAVAAAPSHPPGMHKYQVAFLTRGPRWTPERTPETEALQQRHLAHIREMGSAGKLVAAGPFLDDGPLAGIFVFDTTPEQASALAQADPAVQAGRLVLDLHPWMAAEGVMPPAAP